MKIKNLATCLFLGLGFGANAQNVEFVEYDLDNGLHVILHQDNSKPIVATTIMYHIGAKNDPKGASGAAHFVEHLMFEGSKNIERAKFSEYAEGAGGKLNANTSYDRTFYFELLPSNQLELGLWLESERLLHATMAKEKIGLETQREVVMEERKQRTDNAPYGRFLEETMKRVFTNHPYNNPVGGWMEDMENTTAEQLNTYYETFYVPNNAVLSIAGDIDIETTKALILKYFGDIPAGKNKIERPVLNEEKGTTEVRDTVYDHVQLPALIQAYQVPGQGTDDYYALQMLSQLLSGGNSSRFSTTIRDQKQLALQVSNFTLGLEDASVMLTMAMPNGDVSLDSLEFEIEAQYELVKKELITDREMQKLKNSNENDYYYNFTSMAGIAESLADYHMYFGDANLINTEINKYLSVTKEDIMRVAKKYLTKENRVTIYWLPVQ